jgi:tetratricopeptide (TPR) repeat protein
LRKVVRLEHGDAHGAERLRREAEVLSLQLSAPQMFKSLLTVDLFAYARCRDLANMAQVVEQMRALAAQHPGWTANVIYAEGSFESVRGNYEAAKPKFEACLDLTRPDTRGASSNMGMWLAGHAGLAECLFGMGRYQDARAIASVGLAFAEARKITTFGFELSRILALAEAKLGDPRAADRVEALLEHQRQLGTAGLRLGLSYEARTQIAIWTGDTAAFERYAELTAREYRHGANTPLGVRYDRLMNEAARSGMQAQVSLADFAALTGGDTSSVQRDELLTMVTRSLAGHRSATERKQLALQMICAAHGAGAGHLYLLTPAGPVLCASHGAGIPDAELAEAVTSFVTSQQNRAGEMDEMITGELPHDATPLSAIHTVGTDYELLPLGCVIDASSVLVGVAVISAATDRTRNTQQTQLLSVLAASLIESGDASA